MSITNQTARVLELVRRFNKGEIVNIEKLIEEAQEDILTNNLSKRSNLPIFLQIKPLVLLINPILFLSNYSANSTRNFFVTSTITCNCSIVSFQPRVFKPQSGFTHKRSFGITFNALRNKCSISPAVGTRGL